MAHGPDTEELLKRINSLNKYRWIKNIKKYECQLILNGLNITSIPKLPSNIQYLVCSNTPITELPELPPNLIGLECDNTLITSLPKLPPNLVLLSCSHTKLTELPELPKTLEGLYCPFRAFSIKNENKYFHKDNENIYIYEADNIKEYYQRWKEEQIKNRCQERCAIIKKELILKIWHPYI
jgi:Leucine-rich repeat (LRR) protein